MPIINILGRLNFSLIANIIKLMRGNFMKKLFLFLIPVFFLIGCYREPPMHSIAISIDLNDNVTKHGTDRDFWIETRNVDTITGKYFLIPLSETKLNINSLYSTDPDVIEITDIDTDNYTFTAKLKKTGKAKIRIEADNSPMASSLRIEIKNF